GPQGLGGGPRRPDLGGRPGAAARPDAARAGVHPRPGGAGPAAHLHPGADHRSARGPGARTAGHRGGLPVRKLKDTPQGSFQLRPMTSADLPRVMEIEQVAFRNPWSRDLLARELGHDWSTILVAEEPGPRGMTLLGFVIFWVVHDELHVLNVATAP